MKGMKCDICHGDAVDVWINPMHPGEVLWMCKEDLIEFEAIGNDVMRGLTSIED